MSGHSSAKPEFSNPLIWTVGLVGFALALAWMFGSFMQKGYGDGKQHPKPRAPLAGPAIPDHMALIKGMLVDNLGDAVSLGEGVYAKNCITCHGADGQMGSGGARKFGAEALQNAEYGDGTNPATLYHTLLNGWNGGLMPKQGHLSDEEKYAVIAYMREKFYKGKPEYRELNDTYLAELQAAVPAPREAGADTGAGPNPALKPITIPVYEVLAEQAAATEEADSDAAWYAAIAASDLAEISAYKPSVLRIADSTAAHDLRVAVGKGGKRMPLLQYLIVQRLPRWFRNSVLYRMLNLLS